jgi:NADPH:quinone reductase-like Zn-dependent oxidoreductase
MRVLRLKNSNAVPELIEDSAPRPHPGKCELLIRVHAAGVTRSELEWYPTTHTKSGDQRVGAIPSHEFSGTVTALGECVGNLELGRPVFGMNDWFADGAAAEYCIAPFFAVAPKPEHLTHAEAASVPISALTAWQGLIDRAKIQAGDRILVHGGAGSVGMFAVQLSRLHGAHVTATASEENAAFVKQLGADVVIRRDSAFEDMARDMDVVFDTVGGDVLRRSWGVLKSSGRMVTIAADEEGTSDERTKTAFFIVEPNHKQLSLVSAMLDAGTLRACMDTAFPLTRAADAYLGHLPGHHRGKVVVTITQDN